MFYNDRVEANHQQDKSFHNGLVELKSWKCASRHNGVHFFDISTPKSGPHLVCFVHFDLQMCFADASRHNGVHFFDISTSKSALRPRCFVHFRLEMCFAPQRRAIFHLSTGQLAPQPPSWLRGFG